MPSLLAALSTSRVVKRGFAARSRNVSLRRRASSIRAAECLPCSGLLFNRADYPLRVILLVIAYVLQVKRIILGRLLVEYVDNKGEEFY